jgi:putative membrane protein
VLLDYLFFLLLGVLAGVVAGLLPGLHVNNIGTFSLSLLPLLAIDPVAFAVFLTAMATSQTFLNFIPSIFLGAPDESTVLSLLPTHRLLLDGRGMEAVRITAVASLYGVFLSLALLPVAFFLIPLAYSAVRAALVPILLFAITLLILRERRLEKILWAFITFSVSGYLGWVLLNRISVLSTSQVFLPLFSGLFGLSTLLTGIQAGSKFYPQDLKAEIKLSKKGMWGFSFLGTIGGFLVGLLPAMSPSQIGIVIQEIVSLKERAKGALEELHVRRFITMVAALNTADAMVSIFAVYLMNNPRSGISVIIQDLFGQIDLGLLLGLSLVMLISGIISYFVHIWVGKQFSSLAGRIDFQKLSVLGFAFVVCLVFFMTGFLGLAIAAVSTLVGLIPALTGVSRTHCMGCLLLPTILIFL